MSFGTISMLSGFVAFVYSGLYIVSNSISTEQIQKVLVEDEFVRFVSLLGKYKSGGYYTFSSKDVKSFLDYKYILIYIIL